jgi:hypothetical protein
MNNIAAIMSAKRRLAAAVAVGLATAAAVTIVGGSTVADAAGSADLSVSQVVSNGTGSGNTTVTDPHPQRGAVDRDRGGRDRPAQDQRRVGLLLHLERHL